MTTTHAPPAGHRLPPFYCPVESRVHPRVREIEDRAVRWLDASGMFTDDTERAWNLATHAAEFGCRLAPDGDEERLLLFTLWNHWLFALDDSRLDAEPDGSAGPDITDLAFRLVRCVEVPGSGMLGSGPVAAALDDLAARTRAAVTPVQFQRVCEGLRDLLLGVAWQNGHARRGIMPSLSDYVPGRISDVGGRFDAAFIEVLNRVEVPGAQLYSAPVRALTEATGFIVACDNDLLSYAKEDSGRGPGQNILDVISHEDRCTPAEAVARARALRDRSMTLFLRLREQVAREAGPDLRRYLEGLGHFISGNISWSDTAPRYASPRGRHPLPVPGATLGVTWCDLPSDTGYGRPDVPSVSWWWDQLDG